MITIGIAVVTTCSGFSSRHPQDDGHDGFEQSQSGSGVVTSSISGPSVISTVVSLLSDDGL